MIETPDIIEPKSPFVANMKALWKRWPYLAQDIEFIDDQDLIPCYTTKSSDYTCQLPGPNGEPVFLHSRYDPIREAQRWADGAIKQCDDSEDEQTGRKPMCYLVDGFGLGYHIKALYDKLTGDAFIVVSEQNLALVRTALHLLDYSDMLASGRLVFITGVEREEIFKSLQPHSTEMMLGAVFTRSLQRLDVEFRSAVRNCVGDFASFMRAHMISLLANSEVTGRNVLNNLPTYLSTPSVAIVKGRFTGMPAVVVSAGPSLSKNIQLLKKIRDNVIVIAVQTTLKPLIAQGIRPDFVTSLDYHEVSKRFFEGLEDLNDIHLVAEPKATWHVVDYYRDRGPVSLLYNQFAELNAQDAPVKHDGMKAGATVAHLAFYLAEYIGANPVIFVGQDLGFSDHVYYSPGNALHDVWNPELNRFSTLEMKEWERIIRAKKMLKKVKDIHGNDIYTDEQMYTYLQQFEKDFSESPATIIDATEGGVYKQNSTIMTLQEAADKYCTKPIDKNLFKYRETANWFDTKHLEYGRKSLQDRLDEVAQLKDISERTIKLVKEMYDLVDTDQQQVNHKMNKLDELRTMVRHREKTYQLVSTISQMAEMFRFREDRYLEMDNTSGTDRQKRQLKRDITYVTEIKNGCDRTTKLLEQSLHRFEDDIEHYITKKNDQESA